jgi:hypothetical protein
MAKNVGTIRLAAPQKIDPLTDAEMVPVRFLCRLAGDGHNFLECGDQRVCAVKQGVDKGIGLAFEVAHEISENESEINQEIKNDGQTQKARGDRGAADAREKDETIDRLGKDDQIDD